MDYIKINSQKLEKDVISRAVSILKNGGVVALPTETVYGLVGDLFSKEAVERIYKVKGRQFSKPLPVFVPDVEIVKSYVENLPDWAYKLMKAFCPGPLTVILSKKKTLDIGFQADTLGFRIPAHPVPLALLKEYGALVSTSANPSGEKDALSGEDVKRYFDGKIDLILDGGHTSLKAPSTVVDCTGNSPKIIREGKISKEQIEKIIETFKIKN